MDLPTPEAPVAEHGERRVVVAAIVGAHGIAGEVRLKVFAEDLGAHQVLNGGAFTLRSVRRGNNGAIARFAEIDSRDAAEALRGTQLWVSRDSLPPLEEGEYYHADLLGLAAVSDTGEPLGKVVAVENFGAGDVIEIERPTGKRFMVPMRVDAVPEWDAERLVVTTTFIES
ncbi:ribosome maturation factor RimM [Sphingomonas sp. 3-13AW]|uniref:ribosome maturation factor RimM n=1 Tax=Sphingomonas sp. 3-13AW TaxID=3050450 RepID=UPI003BB63A2A